MMFKLVCALIGHRISRHHVWHDDRDFRTSCRRCRTNLLRDIDDWRVFTGEDAAVHGRAVHPRNRDKEA